MRTPDEVIPQLTEAEERQVAEIESRVEEELGKRERFDANTNGWTDDETGRTIAYAVWEKVVSNARRSGWEASLTGAIVLIKKPPI